MLLPINFRLQTSSFVRIYGRRTANVNQSSMSLINGHGSFLLHHLTSACLLPLFLDSFYRNSLTDRQEGGPYLFSLMRVRLSAELFPGNSACFWGGHTLDLSGSWWLL